MYSEEHEESLYNDNEGTRTQHEPDDIPYEADNDKVQYEYCGREQIQNKTEDYLELDEFKNFDDLPIVDYRPAQEASEEAWSGLAFSS